MSVAETLRTKLVDAFAPEHLEIIDESEQHRGHGGWREGGESHFRIVMNASRLSGESRVGRQRAVNRVLADELAGPVHALAMEITAD